MFYVTHNGSAHIDECAAIAAHLIGTGKEDFWCNIKVIRAGEEEVTRIMNSVQAIDYTFIDCGRKFDGKKYFDHHQYQPGELKTSLTLVVDSFSKLKSLRGSTLYKRIAVQDNLGFSGVAKHYGVTVDKHDFGFCEIESVLVHRFASGDLTIIGLLVEFMRGCINSKRNVEKINDILKDRYSIVEGKVKVMIVDYHDVNKNSITSFASSKGCQILMQKRDDGKYIISRTQNGATDKFSNIKDLCVFVHKTGFMATCEEGNVKKIVDRLIR
jgi:uncharacterized UPF0160 family protein